LIFNKKLYQAGVHRIKDIVRDHKFLTTKELNELYHSNISFLEYGGILNAIPKSWKTYVKNADIELTGEEHIYYIDRITLTCKGIYNELVEKIYTIPEEYPNSWSKELNIQIDELDWIESYQDCVKWTISNKLRSFYYQFRMKDIMTNSKLYKMKIKETAKCNWCENIHQDMIHLFWDCVESRNIWYQLEHWLNSELTQGNLKIEIGMIFLYDIEAGNLTNIINLIVLITCRYIYVSKCLDNKLNFMELLFRIYEIRDIEFNIANSKGKLSYHRKKWKSICQKE